MKVLNYQAGLVAALLALSAHAHAESNGRFTTAPNGSGIGVWVVDTKTGRAKLCFATGTNPNYKVECTDWTK